MKKIFSLIVAAIMFAACSNNEYRITGNIEGAQDGDSVILGYSSDGMEFITVNKAAIKNGEFSFTGKQKGCKIYYIGYENDSIPPVYALFFLEAGDITAEISPNNSIIIGSPMNDLNKEIETSLENYVIEMLTYQEKLYSDSTLSDSEKEELGNKSYLVQRTAMTYIQETIRENIDNMVGLFMLVQYSDLFDNNELQELISAIPEKNIDRENNYLYDILLEIQEERNSSGSLEDIINSISEEGEDFESEESQIVE